jgi:hypothetical protein
MRMSHKRVSPQPRDNKDMEAISTEVMEAVKKNLQQERVTKPFVILQIKDRLQMIFLLSEPPLEDVIKATITARLGQSPFLALAVDTTADIECNGVLDAGDEVFHVACFNTGKALVYGKLDPPTVRASKHTIRQDGCYDFSDLPVMSLEGNYVDTVIDVWQKIDAAIKAGRLDEVDFPDTTKSVWWGFDKSSQNNNT